MSLGIYIIVAIACFLLILWHLKQRWPGWLGKPFVLLPISLILDVIIAPLSAQFLEYRTSSIIVGIAWDTEIYRAIILILLNIGSIWVGLALAAHIFCGNDVLRRKRFTKGHLVYPFVKKRWLLSFIIFVFGLFCHLYVLYILSLYIPMTAFAMRAVYTIEEVVFDPIFNYARVLSGMAIVGAWGMLLFSGMSRRLRKLSMLANVVVLAFPVIHGARVQFIASVLTLLLLHIYIEGTLRFKTVIKLGSVVLAGIIGILTGRFGTEKVSAGFWLAMEILFNRQAINHVAFAHRTFPSIIPFLGWDGILAPLSHLFPTIAEIFGGVNIWTYIVDNLLSSNNPYRGIGGEHFTPSAEHYILFGIKGVVILGLIIGFFYGGIFSWQRRQPNNPFLLMFALGAYRAFFIGIIDGRFLNFIGGMGFGILLPVGILAATSSSRRDLAAMVLIPISLCAISFFLKRLFESALFDYTFAIFLFLAYLFSLKAIKIG